MRIRLFHDSRSLGMAAASQAAAAIRRALHERDSARVVAASASSQIEMLQALTAMPGIDWSKVELFHLDEYTGVEADHPASFRRFLMERVIKPTGLTSFYFLEGEKDPFNVCEAVGKLILARPVDVALVGIGENGHLAFNDPPADFQTERPFIVVELDEACRRQQVGEGWFATMDDVPKQAITMTIRQTMRSREIVCVVPDQRKAHAVRMCLTGPVRPEAPASILRTHPNAIVYLDCASASLIEPDVRASLDVEEEPEVVGGGPA